MTPQSLAPLVLACISLSVALGRVVNAMKLDFHSIELSQGRPVLVQDTIEALSVTTSLLSPSFVGVPVLHSLSVRTALKKRNAKFKRLQKSLRGPEIAPLLALRALFAFGISSIDYILAGVWTDPDHLSEIQVRSRDVYRHVLGLPPWTFRGFLHLPLSQGGARCPLFADRAVSLLTATYLNASLGRNALARAAVLELLSAREPWAEATMLRQALQDWRVSFQVSGTEACDLMPADIVFSGDWQQVRDLEFVVAATDGAATGPPTATRLGAGGGAVAPIAGCLCLLLLWCCDGRRQLHGCRALG